MSCDLKREKWETSSLADIKVEVPTQPKRRPMNVVSALLTDCLCEPFPTGDGRLFGPSEQFIELIGIQFIGLGAVVDELTPKERVYDTLEQLSTRTERLISIGYLVDAEPEETESVSDKKVIETIPLDIWSKAYPNDKNMSRPVKKTIASMKVRLMS